MKKINRFPLIAYSIHLDLCVCFTNETTGIVASSNCKRFNVGLFFDDWIPCFNKSAWNIIAQPSEYPKEMYVDSFSGNEKDALRNKNKRTIVFRHEGIGYIDAEGNCWGYAVDIPEKSNENQEILLKIKMLQEQINEIEGTMFYLKSKL